MNATPRTPDGMTPIRPRTDAERLAELVTTTAYLSASMAYAEAHPGRPIPAAVTITAQTHAADAFAPLAETADYNAAREAIVAVGINTADAYRDAAHAHAVAGATVAADVLAVIAAAIDAGTADAPDNADADRLAAWAAVAAAVWAERAERGAAHSVRDGIMVPGAVPIPELHADVRRVAPDATPDARAAAIADVLDAAADGYAARAYRLARSIPSTPLGAWDDAERRARDLETVGILYRLAAEHAAHAFGARRYGWIRLHGETVTL